MVLQVRPTPTRFPTNSLFTPVDKHTLAFYIKCVPPVGLEVAIAYCALNVHLNNYIQINHL